MVKEAMKDWGSLVVGCLSSTYEILGLGPHTKE